EEMRVYWRYHREESGETLSEIARRYHTTATAIAEANNLEGTELAKDSKLIIPVSPAKPAAPEAAATHTAATASGYSKHPARYTVRKGDTVLSVADDFGVPAEKIRQWNHLKGNELRAGRSLTIFSSTTAVKPVSATTSRHRGRASDAEDDPPRSAHATAKTGRSAHTKAKT